MVSSAPRCAGTSSTGPRMLRLAEPGRKPGRIRGASAAVSGVTVTNGTISNFDAGVVVRGGSHNVITKLTVRENVGNSLSCDLGDGIVTFNSSDNSIHDNTVELNGPLSGMERAEDGGEREPCPSTKGTDAAAREAETSETRDHRPHDNATRISAAIVVGIRYRGPLPLATAGSRALPPPTVRPH